MPFRSGRSAYRTIRSFCASGRVFALGVILSSSAPLFAQSVPTGYQEYFVVGHEEHVWNMMERVRLGEGAGGFPAPSRMNSVISATASADDQIVFYDHWEDGYEVAILAPAQASTLVLGDQNAANGRVCDFSTDPRVFPCNGAPSHDDRLLTGTYLIFNSDQGAAASGCGAGVRCSVTVPRTTCPGAGCEVRFDGGDRLFTSGGPLSMSHVEDPGTPLIGGGTELLSRQTVGNAVSYSVPVGEDKYPGANNAFVSLKYVSLELVAFDDATQVFVTSPGAGSVSFTLNRGQHYSSLGSILPCAGVCPAAALTINSGTKISTTRPLGGMMFTGGPGQYATRHYALLPDLLHASDYVITAPGDNAGVQGSRPLNLYIFNPDPVNALNVTMTYNVPPVTSTTVAVPANSIIDFRNATGQNVPSNSTVRLTSNRNFWGVSSYGQPDNISDWGHAWLAARFLTNNYTVPFAPGTQTPAASAAGRPAACGPAAGPAPGPSPPGTCNTVNRNPVFVSATLDNTLVRIDLDNDGLYDYIDTTSDDYPDQGVATDPGCEAPPVAGYTRCVYRIDSLQALRVWDWRDYDNTGTHILSSKPVAVAWGQDVDQGEASDPSPDTGYTIYPINQSFLDPVLTVDKTASTTSQPTGGGVVTYTLTVKSYGFGPLASVQAYDLLPPGVPGAAYVAGSTLITYPDLTQTTSDPAASIDPVSGRARLDWTLTPATLAANASLTVRYQVTLPPAPGAAPRLLTNVGHAKATLGGSTFNAADTADVVQTNIVLTKAEADDGTPQPGEDFTYTLTVMNGGAGAETNVVIADPLPPETTFKPGSIVNAGPFTGIYSAAQNAVVWTAASFAAGAGPFSLQFKATISPGVPIGTVVRNRASYESTQTPVFLSNEVLPVVVAPSLEISKVGPVRAHPNEVLSFDIRVKNVGSAAATNVQILDAYATNTTYLVGTMTWSSNGGVFTPLSDAADGDQGTNDPANGRLRFALASLGPGEDVVFRFGVQVLPGTNGQFVNNQATVAANEVQTADTNLVQLPVSGSADVRGHVFLDLNGNGAQDAGEPGLANVDVVVTDGLGHVQRAGTDSAGNYLVTVEANPPGTTRLDVDETDPDFPPGATLTTANDPQTLSAIAGATAFAPAVGYRPQALRFAKTSDAVGGQVLPGQTVTYTLTLTNLTGVAQNAIAISDPIPARAAFVPGSTRVTLPSNNNTIRATEYAVTSGSGVTAFNVTLAQNLVADYFVIVQGSDGRANTSTSETPARDYVALTADPFGTGDLAASGAANRLTFTRQGADGNGAATWAGVVTVVECLGDCDASGFRLRSVERVGHGAGTAGTDASGPNPMWNSLGKVALIGGFNGAGCDTADADTADHKSCQVRLFPSGANTINWTRDGTSASLATATSTVMVVEWGTDWSVQRSTVVNGNAGGAGADLAGEYNTAAIAPVLRQNTWVWGTGTTDDVSVGGNAEGVLLTLGDGQNVNAVESRVAAATELGGSLLNFDVWALSHPFLAVDHQFKREGAPSNDANAQTRDVGVAAAGTANARFALSYNGMNNNATPGDTAYPRPMFWARYVANNSVRLERRRWGTWDWAAWVQGIDFAGIKRPATNVGHDAANLVIAADGYSLAPGRTMVVTYKVVIDPALATDLSVNQIVNTASATVGAQVATASATLNVVRAGVTVEPDNAGFGLAGSTLTYSHAVTNTGVVASSYTLRGTSEHGWKLELLDAASGFILATDSNGDGAWDGGVTINTGTLAVGATIEYKLRVTIPAATPVATQDTARLLARTPLNALVTDTGTDESTVLAAADFGKVLLLPDNSGVVTPGGAVVYSHRVVNFTGQADTFDLFAGTASAGWTATFYYDSNGDGGYTPGVDIAINNTRQLANGEAQTVFMVVVADPAAAPGDVDVAHLSATSRLDPTLIAGATDTSTVVTTPLLDLSGGGTRQVQPGDLATFPGTVTDLGAANDRYDVSITASAFYGLNGFDHSSQFWVDTNADGAPDTQVAADSDGDGTWDAVAAGWDTNGNGQPDLPVAPGSTVAYELRRPVDLNQVAYRDFVTLTAASLASSQTDSVTATVLLNAATRAAIRGVRADAGAGIVQFVTGSQHGTLGFRIYGTDDRRGAAGRVLLTPELVRSPVRTSLVPLAYRAETGPIAQRFLVIEELEAAGTHRWSGPFPIGDRRLAAAFDRIAGRLDRVGIGGDSGRAAATAGGLRRFAGFARGRALRAAQQRAALSTPAPVGGSSAVHVEVSSPGLVGVPLANLEAAGLERSRRPLTVTRLGHVVPHTLRPAVGGSELAFNATGLSTAYTGTDVYIVSRGRQPVMGVPLTSEGDAPVGGAMRIERNAIYLTDAPDGTDPWLWDVLFANAGPWPYDWWDPTAGTFDLPGLRGGTSTSVPVRIRLLGYTEAEHTVTASINGVEVGTLTLSGVSSQVLTGSIPAAALAPAGNQVTLDYTALSPETGQPDDQALAYLQYVELTLPPTSVSARRATLGAIRPADASLPSLGGVEYLVVTHSLFHEQAERIAAAKRAEGLSAVVVDVERAYDRWSTGVLEANAVHMLIRFAAERSGLLKYVLLVGDDTFDTHDYLATGAFPYIPSLLARDELFGRIPSESRYADLDGDGLPDVAIGRLPVQTLEHADALADKVVGQQAALRKHAGRHMVAVDNTLELDAPFRGEAEALASRLPAHSQTTWADVDAGIAQARAGLRAGWQAGAAVTHYFGHGGAELWADEDLLSADEVPALDGQIEPTVLLTWGCEAQWFLNLWGPSINEALLLLPHGGAVASFGPVGISNPLAQKPLYEAVYRHLVVDRVPLGLAVQLAKREALAADPRTGPVVHGFGLLGDPAVQVPFEPGDTGQ